MRTRIDTLVIAADRRRFTIWCAENDRDPFDGGVRHISHPDQMRGYSCVEVVWESTPFTWSQDQVNEALFQQDLVRRCDD